MDSMDKRTIFHVDMDAFFASVEILKNPSLKGKPVIVGGDPDKRGVVSTCSYEARAFGVHSAMPAKEAKRLCPRGIFISGSFQDYKHYSNLVVRCLREATPYVEVVSIDEAYLDVSELVAETFSAKELGRQLRQKIYEETGLACSVGIASNKLVAKVASSMAKPNGLYEIPHGCERAFFAPLSVRKIPGIGKKTAQLLEEDGMAAVRDLQQCSLEMLIGQYGSRGYRFYLSSRGIDKRPVEWKKQQRKSISTETTFPKDITDPEQLLQTMEDLATKAWNTLCKKKMRTRTLTIKLRDCSFKTITRSTTLASHTQNLGLIKKELDILFKCSYKPGPSIRLIGVCLDKLTSGYWQPSFWELS